MRKFNLFEKGNKKFKRIVSGTMAGVVVTSGVLGYLYFKSDEVSAKETLDSIVQLVDNTNADNPYSILEITPGDVSFVADLKDAYGNYHSISSNQSMGTIGYYIGGSEPFRADFARIANDRNPADEGNEEYTEYNLSLGEEEYEVSEILDSVMRQDLMNSILKPLEANGILNNKELKRSVIEVNTYDSKKAGPPKPLEDNEDSVRFDAYREVRQGENGLSSEDFKELVSGMNELKKDYYGEYGKAYVDSVAGEMLPLVGDNFIKHYDFENAKEIVARNELYEEELSDYAGNFLGKYLSLSNNAAYDDGFFSYETEANKKNGEFEPNLTANLENDATPNVYATFEATSDAASIGYVALNPEEVTKKSHIPDNIPLYKLDGDIYYYAGTFGEYVSGEAVSSNSASDVEVDLFYTEPVNSEVEIDILSEIITDESDESSLDVLDEDVSFDGEMLFEEGNMNYDMGSSLLSEDEIPTDPEGQEEPEEPEIPEEPGVFEGYYTVEFAYTEMATGDNHYTVSSFYGADEEMGAQYVLDTESEYGIIVPSYDFNGCIAVNDVPNSYFVYDYKQDMGNFRWNPIGYADKKFNDSVIYNIRGSKIYYDFNVKNNEWFKQWVFDRELGEQCDKLPIDVTVRKASEVKNDDVYMNNFISIISASAANCIGETVSFYDSSVSDISGDILKSILSRVIDDKMPVFADYGIVDDIEKLESESVKNAFAVRLVQALMLDNVDLYLNAIKSLDLTADTNNIDPNSVANVKMMLNNNCHFVNKNIYIYNMKWDNMLSGTVQNILNPYFYTMDKGKKIKGFSDSEVEAGFTDVLLDIQNENLYRETDNGSGSNKLLDENITEATALRYIIGYSTKRSSSSKGVMNILEIEPDASFDLEVEGNTQNSTKNNNETGYKARNGTFSSRDGKLSLRADGLKKAIISNSDDAYVQQDLTEINLTRMSTAEFIGHIEDINAEYDMIYIGTNIDLFNTQSYKETERVYVEEYTKDYDAYYDRWGRYQPARKEVIPAHYEDREVTKYRTVYNDSRMNGLIYSNIGDFSYVTEAVFGIKDEEYQNGNRNGKLVSYVGNDLNSPKYLSRYSGNDITEEKVKQLQEFVNAGYPVIFADDFYKSVTSDTKDIDATKIDKASYMYEFANSVKDKKNVFPISKLSGKLFNWYINLSKPQVTMYEQSLDAMNSAQKLSKNSSDGYYYATYDFSIENKGAASSESTYNAGLYIDVNADGKYSHSQEGIEFTRLRETGGGDVYKNAEGKYELTTGVQYSATCKLAPSFTGVLPWRIEITQNDNPIRRSNATGYYQICRDDKPEIKVLQITNKSGSTWNMQESSTNGSNFDKWLHTNDDKVPYDVQITTVNNEWFNSNGKKNDINHPLSNEDQYYRYLCDYDMLVLGFADCYIGPNEEATLAIQHFINDGRSVLFTHDCTSFVNAPKNAYTWDANTSNKIEGATVTWWGYDFNRYIRNLVGMDRYNALDGDATNHNYDIPYYPNRGLRNEDNIIYDSTGKRGDVKHYGQNHGFSNFVVNFYGYHGSRQTNLSGYQNYPGYLSLKGIDNNNGQKANNTVTKVNDGQITKYPYELADSFRVADTHAQYYQLDFTADDDLDGESDIVVWYCISDSANQRYEQGDIYEMSPDDVRNNYYIYNKGNITYSGVGHKSVMEKGSEMEIKLFINTLIAAYRTGIHEPAINIVESYAVDAKTTNSLYVSYDKMIKASDNNGIIEEKEDLFFNTQKVSLVQNSAFIDHRISAKVYYDVAPGTAGAEEIVKSDGTKVYGKKINLVGNLYYLDEFGNEQLADPTNLKDGVTYKTKIPVTKAIMGDLFDDYDSTNLTANVGKALNTRNIYIVATDTSINTRSGIEKSMSSVATASLVRTQVFDLD